jgi:hypothetical protein
LLPSTEIASLRSMSACFRRPWLAPWLASCLNRFASLQHADVSTACRMGPPALTHRVESAPFTTTISRWRCNQRLSRISDPVCDHRLRCVLHPQGRENPARPQTEPVAVFLLTGPHTFTAVSVGTPAVQVLP